MPRNEDGQFVPKEEVVEDEEKGPEYVENPVLTDLTKVGEGRADTLREAGYEDVSAVAAATPPDLFSLYRFGPELSSRIIRQAKQFLEDTSQRTLQWNQEKQEYELQDPEYWECECGKRVRQETVFQQHQKHCEEVDDD